MASEKCFIIFGEWHNNILAAVTAENDEQALVRYYKHERRKEKFELFKETHQAKETRIFAPGNDNFDSAFVKECWLNRIVPEIGEPVDEPTK